jgi:hypothetical protein
MFTRMSFGTKIKCIFEQIIIIFLLVIAADIVISVFQGIFSNLLFHLPSLIKETIERLIFAVLFLICFLTIIVIVIHVFKARYLDYYLNNKKEPKKEEPIEEEGTSEQPTKQEYKNDKRTIVIRDEKHSSGRFLNFLITVIVGLFKLFLAWWMVPLVFAAGGIAACICLSFLVYKTGLFFIGLLIGGCAALVLVIDILIVIMNFILNRQNNKKAIIYSFLISLVIGGLSCGLVFMGSLNFETIDDDDPSLLISETKEYNMNKDLIVFPYDNIVNNLEFKEKDIDNIQVEYTYNKYTILSDYMNKDNTLLKANANNNNKTQVLRGFIEQLNNRKIVNIFDIDYCSKITIYTNKDNITILKANLDNYINENEKQAKYTETLENTIKEQKTRIQELEDEINELKKDS